MCSNPSCIYCGVTTDLSESDIIPDALTNARIINKNVCRTEHNNKFSDLFESKVIKELAFIANELDIKSRKSKSYAVYNQTLDVDGVEYDISKISSGRIFDGRVLKSIDKKYMMSTPEKLKKIVKNPEEIEIMDVNSKVLSRKININTKIFFSTEMFRMVAKIAYEWYCAKNDVKGWHQEFANVISYITTGKGTCPVTIIQEKGLYDLLQQETDLGSHCIFCFQDEKGRVNVVCSLFGIMMYRVLVAEKLPDFCFNNFMYIELRTDSSRKEIVKESYEDAEYYYLDELTNNKSIEEHEVGGMKIRIRLDIGDSTLMIYPFVLNITKCFNEFWTDIKEPNQEIGEIVFRNINNIVKSSLLHKKSIKRFVNEYFYDGHRPIEINPESSDKRSIFNLYIVYLIGKNNCNTIDEEFLKKITMESLGIKCKNEIVVDDEFAKKLRDEILNYEKYSDVLECGANIIKAWK